jgi:hypothetical protein
MAQMAPQEEATKIEQRLFGTLTPEQVRALEARERAIFGEGGSVRSELPRLRQSMEQKMYRSLLPGYVRHFVEKAAPFMHIEIEGHLDGIFQLSPRTPDALDWLLPLLEAYPGEVRGRYTLSPLQTGEQAIFLRPGEPLFDRWQTVFCDHFSPQALRGAVFVDPGAEQPYFYHLALITVTREADPTIQAFKRSELLACLLVGLRQEEHGAIVTCPVEHLLLLQKGSRHSTTTIPLATTVARLREQARAYALKHVAGKSAREQRERLQATLGERERFVEYGFTYQNAELFEVRKRLSERAQTGDARARGELICYTCASDHNGKLRSWDCNLFINGFSACLALPSVKSIFSLRKLRNVGSELKLYQFSISNARVFSSHQIDPLPQTAHPK